MSSLFDLNGKVAIVTGGSGGLGAAMSLGLAEAGADIVLVDRRGEEETARAIEALGRKALQVKGDLSDRKFPEAIVRECVREFGKVDILVNNAGIIRRTPVLEFSEKDWDDVMEVNARSVFFLSQAAAKDMVKRKMGKIINVASLLSFQGGIWVPSYSKARSPR
jgi:2-deoxy-D-gluconate 3-dehydrogenase